MYLVLIRFNNISGWKSHKLLLGIKRRYTIKIQFRKQTYFHVSYVETILDYGDVIKFRVHINYKVIYFNFICFQKNSSSFVSLFLLFNIYL